MRGVLGEVCLSVGVGVWMCAWAGVGGWWACGRVGVGGVRVWAWMFFLSVFFVGYFFCFFDFWDFWILGIFVFT